MLARLAQISAALVVAHVAVIGTEHEQKAHDEREDLEGVPAPPEGGYHNRHSNAAVSRGLLPRHPRMRGARAPARPGDVRMHKVVRVV
eukprot:scaffold7203_cov416-Prasinococcus_capsulatus_cf.AAC.3